MLANTNIDKSKEFGKAVAQLYIASQHFSLEGSDAACDLIVNANEIAKLAFDEAIKKDGRYSVYASSLNNV